ncbi:MAG TPA: SRPBCC family protein [Solirubrobacteraceae bacterium]|nr:SRPBCC family protein [Solirubrobacteraceae bacterium]
MSGGGSAIEIAAEQVIACSAERIFEVIVDLRGQDRWLSRSSSYRGTAEISANPATLGTTYREPGPLGVRNGTVTELEHPAAVTFHQPMMFRFGLGTADVLMRYALVPEGGSTRVRRTVRVTLPPALRLLRPVVVRAFRSESARTLRALKAYADQLG